MIYIKQVISILIFLGQTVSVSHIMGVYGHHLKEQHREVQIKHDLMTRKCKYTLMA